MSDEFEPLVAGWLGSMQADDAEVEHLRSVVAGLPARERPVRSWFAFAGMATALALVLAVFIAWRPSIGPGGPGSYLIASDDPRFAKCFGTKTGVVAAFPMTHASDYQKHLPRMGFSPELQTNAPAFSVVFDAAHQWATYGGPVLSNPTDTFHSAATPQPGHVDVCVWVGNASTGDFFTYGDVDISGMQPVLAVATPKPGSLRTYTFGPSPEIAFDYPAEWRIIKEAIWARHYQWIPVVLGTGDWKLNCTANPSGNGGSCGADIFTVEQGEIVVEIYTMAGPSALGVSPPSTAFSIPNGWQATVEDSTTSSTWNVFAPGWLYPVTVEAHFAGPGAEELRIVVRDLVESMRAAPSTPSPNASAQAH